MKELLVVAFIAFIFWLWRDSMKSREIALLLGKRACQDMNMQFLDDTVSLKQWKLCRNKSGSVALCRLYGFEFTQFGEARYEGAITMRGLSVEEVLIDLDQAS